MGLEEHFFRSKLSTTLVVPFSVSDRCCTREIAVPWNDNCELVELVLLSILSTAAN